MNLKEFSEEKSLNGTIRELSVGGSSDAQTKINRII